jgi:hypothetical protein
MKKGLLIVLLLNSYLLFAQEIESSNNMDYFISEPFDGMSTYMGIPLGHKRSFVSSGQIVSFQHDAGKFTFIKHDSDSLNEIFRNDVLKKESLTTEGVEQLGERYYYFFSRWDRSQIAEQLFVREIDFEKCDFVGPENKLYSSTGKLNGVGPYLVTSMYGAFPKFRRTKSLSGNRLLVTYTWQLKRKDRKTKNLKIGMHVYDEAMNEIWHRIVELPRLADDVSVYKYIVDKNGNAYVLAKIFNDESEERKDKTGSHLVLFCVNGETGTITATDISVNGVFVNEVMLTENSEGKIVVFGLYNKSIGTLTDGVFSTILNEKGETLQFQKIEIPDSIISLHAKKGLKRKIEKSAEGTNWGLSNLVLKDAVYGNNGSVTLFAEVLTVGNYTTSTIRQSNVAGQRTTTTRYSDKSNIRYGDILVAHIDTDSSLSRFKIIPKKQVASVRGEYKRDYLIQSGFGELGFALTNKQADPYVIYIDNIKNFNLAESEVPVPHRNGLGGFLTGYKVDQKSGKLENITFFDLKDANGKILKNFSVQNVLQLSENEIVIEFATDVPKKHVLVKVNLPQ